MAQIDKETRRTYNRSTVGLAWTRDEIDDILEIADKELESLEAQADRWQYIKGELEAARDKPPASNVSFLGFPDQAKTQTPARFEDGYHHNDRHGVKITMPDGSEWFHSYTGGAPVQL